MIGPRSILDSRVRAGLQQRFGKLRPDAAAHWGRLNAPRMLVHLSDQLRHALGDAPTAPRPGPLRLPIVKQLVMYWVPWPKGKVKGPAEAFLTRPTSWAADLATFESLLDRFVAATDRTGWPDHAIFGRMSRGSWARFSYRHFDHHLRQFGV